jgi:hypothetical protein
MSEEKTINVNMELLKKLLHTYCLECYSHKDCYECEVFILEKEIEDKSREVKEE